MFAQEYAAALMRVTLGSFWGFISRTGFGISGTESRSFRRGADNGSVLTEVSSWIHAAMVARKDAAQYPGN